MRLRHTFICVSIFLTALAMSAQLKGSPGRLITKLSDGVYEIRHEDAPDGFPQGNTTVVIGDEAVLVMDSTYLPSAALQDIAQIRQWTSKPVRYLVLSHGHYDHTMGNSTYAREFPGLTIIAHAETLTLMATYTPGLAESFSSRAQRMHTQLESGKDKDDKPLDAQKLEELRKDLPEFEKVVEEVKAMGDNPLPKLTFEDGTFSLDLGHREAQIKFMGRGNTAGDVVLFLPKERIAAVGDILVSPVPYTCSGFPVEWRHTLTRIADLKPSVIVPGHGEIMRDLNYLTAVHDLFDSVVTQVESQIYKPGATLETLQKTVDVTSFQDRFPKGDAYNPDFFHRSIPNCLIRNTFYQIWPK